MNIFRTTSVETYLLSLMWVFVMQFKYAEQEKKSTVIRVPRLGIKTKTHLVNLFVEMMHQMGDEDARDICNKVACGVLKLCSRKAINQDEICRAVVLPPEWAVKMTYQQVGDRL
jgi:hypothetical protein